VIFAFHAYPWLIHRLTYRRTNHGNIHVRGYKEEGTITTAFDMTVLNEIDRFHLVLDTLDRLPPAGAPGQALREKLCAKLIEHHAYIGVHGEDLPEIRDWRWAAPPTGPRDNPARLKQRALDRWENEGGEIPHVHPVEPRPAMPPTG
jgi:xylulose-5-phosphate/fructose-6-phosphate phosphoketolase